MQHAPSMGSTRNSSDQPQQPSPTGTLRIQETREEMCGSRSSTKWKASGSARLWVNAASYARKASTRCSPSKKRRFWARRTLSSRFSCPEADASMEDNKRYPELRRRLSPGWWTANRHYAMYMVREWTSLFVALYSLIFIYGLSLWATGSRADFLSFLKNPAVVGF